DDARVATVALGEAGGHRVEEAVDHLRVRHHGEYLASRVEVLALGQGDHVLGRAADGLGLGLGSRDALVAEEGHQEIAEHRPAMLGAPPELVAVLAMPHFTPPRPRAPSTLGSIRMPRDSPRAARAVLISSIDFSPRFLTCSRSASVFCARSATIVRSAALRALMARADKASSSRSLPRASRR